MLQDEYHPTLSVLFWKKILHLYKISYHDHTAKAQRFCMKKTINIEI